MSAEIPLTASKFLLSSCQIWFHQFTNALTIVVPTQSTSMRARNACTRNAISSRRYSTVANIDLLGFVVLKRRLCSARKFSQGMQFVAIFRERLLSLWILGRMTSTKAVGGTECSATSGGLPDPAANRLRADRAVILARRCASPDRCCVCLSDYDRGWRGSAAGIDDCHVRSPGAFSGHCATRRATMTIDTGTMKMWSRADGANQARCSAPCTFCSGGSVTCMKQCTSCPAATAFSKTSPSIRSSSSARLRNFTFATVLRVERSPEGENRLLKVKIKTFVSFAMVASPK